MTDNERLKHPVANEENEEKALSLLKESGLDIEIEKIAKKVRSKLPFARWSSTKQAYIRSHDKQTGHSQINAVVIGFQWQEVDYLKGPTITRIYATGNGFGECLKTLEVSALIDVRTGDITIRFNTPIAKQEWEKDKMIIAKQLEHTLTHPPVIEFGGIPGIRIIDGKIVGLATKFPV